MKHLLRSMILAAALLIMICSTATGEEPFFSGIVSTKVLPRYTLGNANVATRKAVSHSVLRINTAIGVYLEVFNSKSLTGAGLGNEENLTIGYTRFLDAKRTVNVNIGFAYKDIAPTFSYSKKDVFEPYIEVSKKIESGFTPYVRMEAYINVPGTAPTKIRSAIGSRHLLPITETLELNQNLIVLYDHSSMPGVSCVVARHTASLSWRIRPDLSIDLSNDTFIPFSGKDAGKDKVVSIVPGVGLTYRFTAL